MAFDNIIVERRDNVGLITLNRPKALNALSGPLMDELGRALDDLEAAFVRKREVQQHDVEPAACKAFEGLADPLDMANLALVSGGLREHLADEPCIARVCFDQKHI